MVRDLILALLAAAAAGVLPGLFWARLLYASGAGRAGLLAFSVAFSITLTSALALAASSLLGSGITLPIALLSPLAVFLSGFVLYRLFGPPKGRREPLARRARARFSAATEGRGDREDLSPPAVVRTARAVALPAVMVLVLARAYVGPVVHDWPYIRGIDQYIQSVMVNLALSGGEIREFMVYPPGFHGFLAVVSRLGGLGPLDLFPVLGPAFLLLPPLALYTLAREIWGRWVGVAAALFSGVILTSSHTFLIEARYLHLTTAQFLMVLAITAFLGFLAAPSVRSGLLLSLIGSSVVLYHPVSSFYTALVLGTLGALFLPYLLIRERRTAVGLVLSSGLLGALALVYAWETYSLGTAIPALLGGANGGTGAAVTGAIGTQPVYELSHLPRAVSSAVLALGLAGLAALALDRAKEVGAAARPYFLAKITLFAWTAIMFVGSRTAASGFPERFERDLGVPLALLAAFASVTLLGAALNAGARRVRLAATALTVPAFALIGWQAYTNLVEAAGPVTTERPGETERISMTPEFEAAGEWLRRNNTGGNILVSPYLNGLPSRAMLAMGEYSGVQTFDEGRIRRNRDLPPSGQEPMREALYAIQNPASERTREILDRYDVRYLVLYKSDDPTSPDGNAWRGFEERPDLYRKAFERESVVIYRPLAAEAAG
ncbi:Hypothetical Protein RradSPS_0491 [Rubrobacter radiotolerans]|uniref:Dolichyl-phosphate-mannose-protein mannosyltransferase n=1 Tax=Rubrobacter radiotolerans TaxID=42256 RepID=A0A023X132_RUBRA|nr:hypothetical protein [Rubrobacter radiotolerans]AHY45774.1 Hypothetical Protein RradSPS_0491 [Rubrobacter radiotolerans]MDX5893189.1 hypothetical protein [Rubrobacter radiotolerans]SMC03235.1 conserved hypothetical protein [Rubrobacter radiotolerans DSM 5868]